jgi:transposase-like protein
MTQQVVLLSVGGNTVREITKHWKMPVREWSAPKTQFAVVFGDRFEVSQ